MLYCVFQKQDDNESATLGFVSSYPLSESQFENYSITFASTDAAQAVARYIQIRDKVAEDPALESQIVVKLMKDLNWPLKEDTKVDVNSTK